MTIDLTSFDMATATTACADETHTIRWEAGDLTALDHGELEGELALAALGGARVACLEILTAWRRHRRNHRLLSALTRGPGDFVSADRNQLIHRIQRGQVMPGRPAMAMPRPMPTGRPAAMMGGAGHFTHVFGMGGAGSGRAGQGPPVSPLPADQPSDHDHIEMLARLGGAIPWRLGATVTAALLEASTSAADTPSPPTPALTASLVGRVRATVSSWYGDASLPVDVEVIEPGSPPYLRATSEQGILIGLPLRWVADVWGRGLAVIGERLTLAVVEARPDHAVLVTVDHDLRTRRRIAVHTLPPVHDEAPL